MSAAMRLRELTDVSAAVAATRSRKAKTEAISALLAGAEPDEVAAAGAFLSGRLTQRQIGVGWAQLREPPPPAPALTLHGDLSEIARIALADGRDGLAAVRLEVGRPLSPMLAATAPDVGAALEKTGRAAVEHKLDGARVQIHRDGEAVAVFTRSLDDVTAHVPEAVEAALGLSAEQLVLDGEVIALREDGTPHPFQITGSRFGSRRNLEELRREIPLSVFFFDLLHLDGEDLLDAPLSERAAALDRLAPGLRIPHAVADDAERAQATFDEALAAGHEGV